MKKPVLVVMAAGMGSRYGGLKQMDPVGSHGEVIMDYSLYDARRAGFHHQTFYRRSIQRKHWKSCFQIYGRSLRISGSG